MARKCKHGRTKAGKCRKASKRSHCKCATRSLCIKKLRFVSRMKKGRILKARREEAMANLYNG